MNNSAVSFIAKRIWMVLCVLLLLVLILYVFLNPPGGSNSEAVATVNGVTITKDHLYDALIASGGDQTLSKLIDSELVDQEAEKAGVEVTEADIEEELSYVKSGFSSEEEFLQALSAYGMTLDSLKADMKSQVQLRKLLEPQVSVTDEDIQTYYDENLDSLKEPEQVKASHILVATKEEADAVLAELNGGADFAAVAKEKSLDTATAENGGELDFIAKGEMEEAFETAAFALEIGKLSSVVETSSGFHVIKISERKAEYTPTLDEKKDELAEQLKSDKISELSTTWIEEKRAEADIENTLAS